MIPTEAADRAREQAEDRAERNHIEPDAETLADALTDIADRLIAGKTVDGWTMADVLDCWIDETPTRKSSADLAALLNVFADNGSASAFWLNALDWQHKLVAAHFPTDKVRERAEEMARDSAEDQRMEAKR